MKEMKISKLFHWLYAFLMLVPVAIFGANTIYYGFNDKAEAQTYTKQEPIYYNTNDVNSIDSFVADNAYFFNGNNFVQDSYSATPFFIREFIDLTGNVTYTGYSQINFLINYSSVGAVLYTDSGTQWVAFNNRNIAFVFDHYNSHQIDFSNVLDKFSSYDLYIKDYDDLTYTMGIADSLVNSLDHTFDLPMFKWTRDSVVYTAFNGLSVFAGLGENSIFACFLTYWLDISLIWLAFDMLMFLPMWAHSMLDKKKGW